jgi:hypothetical protein
VIFLGENGIFEHVISSFDGMVAQHKEMMDANIKSEKEKIAEMAEINKRIIALSKMQAVAFAVAISFIVVAVAFIYFTADYGYGDINQYQNGSQSEQTITNGDEN